jgi:hypothetical protein
MQHVKGKKQESKGRHSIHSKTNLTPQPLLDQTASSVDVISEPLGFAAAGARTEHLHPSSGIRHAQCACAFVSVAAVYMGLSN